MPGRAFLWLACLVCLCIALWAVLSLPGLSIVEVINGLATGTLAKTDRLTLVEFRLPRFVACLGTGAVLGLAGYVLQQLSANPLADAYTTGVAPAAALGAQAGLLLGQSPEVSLALGIGLSVLLAGVVLGGAFGGRGRAPFILLGFVAGAGCNALLSLLLVRYQSSPGLRSYLFWTFGSVDTATWPAAVGVCLTWLAGALILAWQSGWLLFLSLGRERVTSLGHRYSTRVATFVMAAAGLAAVATALFGVIGFVGLVAPHLVRRLAPAATFALWAVSIVGAVLVAFADGVGRLVYPPFGLPAGILTSLVGIPFFVLLVRKR